MLYQIRNFYLPFALLFSIIFTGCTNTADMGSSYQVPSASLNSVYLHKNHYILLPSCNSIKKERTYRQLVTFMFQGQKHTLQSVVIFKPESLDVNYFSLSSIPLYRILYEDNSLKITDKAKNIPFPQPSQMVFDIMLAYDELCSINDTLPPLYILKKEDDFNYLYDDHDRLIYEIEYRMHNAKREPYTIRNHVFNYTIKLHYL
jgi:hypothetical protein